MFRCLAMKRKILGGYENSIFFPLYGNHKFLSNFSLDVSCTILTFSVTCVKLGDGLALFLKKQTLNFYGCSSSGKKGCVGTLTCKKCNENLCSEAKVSQIKKIHSGVPLFWPSGTFFKFANSEVLSPRGEVPGSWMYVLVMNAQRMTAGDTMYLAWKS